MPPSHKKNIAQSITLDIGTVVKQLVDMEVDGLKVHLFKSEKAYFFPQPMVCSEGKAKLGFCSFSA